MNTLRSRPLVIARRCLRPGWALWMPALLALAPALRAEIPEPETLFYGRIVNRSSGQEMLVSTGRLDWIVRSAQGLELVLQAKIEPLHGGLFSYRLAVPHEALSLGLSARSNAIPLRIDPTRCDHFAIRVDGQPASIRVPGRDHFDLDQALRAATFRLDLEVAAPLPDSDGDGIPDWWEDQYGLDKLSAADATSDRDGDGWNARAEFRRGSNPNQSDATPSLATRELLVYAGATTLVRLQSIDSDSAPANLVYRLLELPAQGTLRLRNAQVDAANPDATLAAGDEFTQADVNRGRLTYAWAGGGLESSALSFRIALRDENSSHVSSTGTVALAIYQPDGALPVAALAQAAAELPAAMDPVAGVSDPEQQKLANYLLGRDLGYHISDAADTSSALSQSVPSSGLSLTQYLTQYVPAFGPDRPHVIAGGMGDDELSGGMANDVLIGGPGADRLRGGGGADVFMMLTQRDGNDTIDDFNLADHDAVDFTRILRGTSTLLSDYLRASASGNNTLIGVSFAGTGNGYSNMVVTLANFSPGTNDLTDLIENGHILARGRWMPARVNIRATMPLASENGPAPGEFLVTRSGSATLALTVNLRIAGSAANGVDYTTLDPQVIFAPGQRAVAVRVNPYIDTVTELAEVVELTVLPGPSYQVGSLATAQVMIEDLAPQIAIETLEPLANKSTLSPGMLLVSRGGILDRSVLVRLTIGGTATSGTDYTGVPTFLNFLPGQTTALIEVTPRPTAVLSNGIEFVQVSLKPDASYKIMFPAVARVILVEEQMTFSLWRQRYFPGAFGDLGAFANADPDHRGVRNLFRYAFGLDAQNPQATGLPRHRLYDNRLAVLFRRPAAVSDLQYLVEVSDDLRTWRADTNLFEPFAPPDLTNDVETLAFRLKRSVEEAPQSFLRVRLSY